MQRTRRRLQDNWRLQIGMAAGAGEAVGAEQVARGAGLHVTGHQCREGRRWQRRWLKRVG